MSLAGKLTYHLVYKTRADLLNLIRDLRIYGFQKEKLMRAFRRDCETALVQTLAKANKNHSPEGVRTDVYYLGGDGLFPLIACSMISLIKAGGDGWRFHLLPDQSGYSPGLVERFRDFGGTIKFHQEKILKSEVDKMLPAEKYPVLHNLRANFLLARKLIDLNAAEGGYRLFIDVDTVFWRDPAQMVSLIQTGAPFAQTDYQDSYVVAKGCVEDLCGSAMPAQVNTGLVGLDPRMMDWDWLEYCCGRIQTLPAMAEGQNKHFLEQTLYALMFGKMNGFNLLPQNDYIVRPCVAEVKQPQAVFHHYVFPCRHLFYKHAWQQVLSK